MKVIRKKSKHVVQAIQFYKNFFGQTEKECNKCGFASFSLHVLYVHRYKCKGGLLGSSMVCCYCQRKFNLFNVYRKHKLMCVNSQKNKNYWKTRENEKHLINNQKIIISNSNSRPILSNEELKNFYFSNCSGCKRQFCNAEEYETHKKNNMCNVILKSKNAHSLIKEKHNFSARKSFPNSKYNIYNLNSEDDREHNSYLDTLQNYFKSCFECTYCKNIYSTKNLLFNHLEKNKHCAKAYVKPLKKNYHHSARKSLHVVARKSISYKRSFTSMSTDRNFEIGSARKSMHRSSNVKSKFFSCVDCKENFYSSADFHFHKDFCTLKSSTLNNRCPVCLQEFSNALNLIHHQNKINHWGKATKSASSVFKCPFCNRTFFTVMFRNSHLHSHSERLDEIKIFLRKTTCEICSHFFATESSKLQHVKISHSSKYEIKDSSKGMVNRESDDEEAMVQKTEQSKLFKDITLPEVIKNKMRLYPTKCPVCRNSFSTIFNRNRHYLRLHMMEATVECTFCNTKCSKADLVYHMQELHNDNLEFQCSECQQRFESRLLTLHHATRSHPNLDPNALILNLKAKHDESASSGNNEKSCHQNSDVKMINNAFYCDICEISFVKLYGLQRHRQSKFHRDTLTKNLDAVRESLSILPSYYSSPDPEKATKQPEIINCSECSEEFTSMMDFVPHRLSHFSSQTSITEVTELNPYSCEICNQKADTHQRVQVHLFGHLQFQEASTKNVTTNQGFLSKTDPIIPDRLSGQHIAKKSFTKKGKNPNQEVIIGGIRKPLFTCDACGIGFMTEFKHSTHIRQFCKVQKLSANNGEFIKVRNDKNVIVENSLTKIRSNNINLEDKEADSSHSQCIISGKCIQCKLCNCVFAGLNLFHKHIDSYCNSKFYDDNAVNINDKIDDLKSAINDELILTGCIRCGLPFDDLPSLTEHMIMHKTDNSSTENIEEKTRKTRNIKSEFRNLNNDNLLENRAFPNASRKTENNLFAFSPTSPSKGSQIDNESFNSNVSTIDETDSDITSAKVLVTLRENFSQLLCVLISDADLMSQLGYNDQVIDNVLVNVLKQMGETPCLDDGNNELDNLRKNIKILLDICLKDQVMEIIADGQTSTDNVVIEALKMFNSEKEAQPI